ncbi:hypothetical protein [Paraflavitalea speifideaquila]|uniref:hypothetical protein n=1 Tax=Paraflavitalea speifideaquila TaxID=3076558 RepID=UPI0028EF9502|nr:hypothetical protein [Paraflavitalea speifideiaquila]
MAGIPAYSKGNPPHLKKERTGYSVNDSYFPGARFVSAKEIYAAFRVPDTITMKVIAKLRPFYLISAPLFYHNHQRAIVFIEMVGGYGMTYFLEKKMMNGSF